MRALRGIFFAAFVGTSAITAAAARRPRVAVARLRALTAPTITAARFARRTPFRVPRTGPPARRCPTVRLLVLPPRVIVASLVALSVPGPMRGTSIESRHDRAG